MTDRAVGLYSGKHDWTSDRRMSAKHRPFEKFDRNDPFSSLVGARVLITGAGRGLGAALAICLADAGCRVIVSARNKERAAETAHAIRLRGGTPASVLQLDLAAPDLTRVSTTVQKAGGLDILVHNGAEWLEGRNTSYGVDEVYKVVDAAVSGPFVLTQRLLPILLQAPSPQVLTIGSLTALPNALLGNASVPFYAAKQGQRGLVDGLRAATSETPIRFHCIHPPLLDDFSPLSSEWSDPPRAGGHATNRDVVEAALFALSRPPHLALTSLVMEGI